MPTRAARIWRYVAVAIALASVPVAIFISGQARNAASDKLCDYAQNQWRATNGIVLRFTEPGTEDRAFVLDQFGPYPDC